MIRAHASDTGRIFVDTFDCSVRQEIDIETAERMALHIAMALDRGDDKVTVDFLDLLGANIIIAANRRAAAYFVADLVEAARAATKRGARRMLRPANDR